MRVLLIAAITAILPQFLCANEIYRFIPSNSQQVLQINLKDLAGMESIRQDLVSNINRQTGLDPKNEKVQDFSNLIEKVVAVTPNLMVDETFIFVKFKITEAEFCRKIEELTGSKLVPVPGTNPVERRFIIEGNRIFPGITMKKRTFAVRFLCPNVAVFAKDELSNYRITNGLPMKKRKELDAPRALVSGFVEFTPEFLADNPYLPQIQRAVYSLSGEKDGSVRIQAAAVCADEKMANQTLIQIQQFVMVGGLMLNQVDPELMQEWITSIRAGRDKNAVSVNAFFTKSFITRLAAASEKAAAELNPSLPPAAKPEKKR
ncbi:MAG: hypothetical protein IJH79_17600 [Lentisphaeria bacterium]|nr:hypothetical protein [Lentisphaeria bacterium]